MENFLSLLVELNIALLDYLDAFKDLRHYFIFNESFDLEKSKYKELKRQLDYTEKRILEIQGKIDEFFNEGYYEEMSEEMSIAISDEYKELLNTLDNLEFTVQSKTSQKFPDLLSFYNTTIKPEKERLDNNINLYNEKAVYENWSFKIISLEEAEKEYLGMKRLIQEKKH